MIMEGSSIPVKRRSSRLSAAVGRLIATPLTYVCLVLHNPARQRFVGTLADSDSAALALGTTGTKISPSQPLPRLTPFIMRAQLGELPPSPKTPGDSRCPKCGRIQQRLASQSPRLQSTHAWDFQRVYV